MQNQSSTPIYLYVGTFTRQRPHSRGKAEGIYVYRADPTTGDLSLSQVMADVPNPSFLTLSPSKRFLYAVNANPEIDGHPGGAVSAFAVDPTNGSLTYLNREASHGVGPCHVSVDQTERCVLVTNYGSGSVAVLPIQDNGRLTPASDVIQHEGAGADPQRQQGPHAHSLNLDPANRFALVCDLGLDKVLVYRFDPSRGKLTPHESQSWVQTRGGAGPRHLAFHPNGRFVYVINELNSTLMAFEYSAADGTLREVQTVSTLPEGFTGENSCADVHVAPSGRFVYGSNRGHDSIVIYGIDEGTGRLTYVGHESTRGQTPRNFTFDLAGTGLLAANQDSDTIVAYRVNQETGRLAFSRTVAEVASPVCLKFVRFAS